MQAIKHISIPKPCHQDWHQMTPNDKGRHCQSCCKTVVDFTSMTNADVIAYLASNTNTCGHFTPSQLNRINFSLAEPPAKVSVWKSLVAVTGLMALIPVYKAEAAKLPKNHGSMVLVPGTAIMSGHSLIGTVNSAADETPLQGVSIVLKGTATGTQTAADGGFKLLSVGRKDTLVISHIGYKTIELPAIGLAPGAVITLQAETSELNEVQVSGYNAERCTSLLGAVTTVCHCREPFFKRVWIKIKHIF